MADKTMVASRSRAVRARFAFVALLALSFLFVQSLQTPTHANPKKGKKATYGRVLLTVGPGGQRVFYDGLDAGPATIGERRFEYVTPGPHKFEVEFENGERWVREIVVEAGRIYCIGLTYTPKTTRIIKPEYCKPFGAVNVATQREFKIGGEPVTFKATVADYSGDVEPIYTWSISAGTIMRGQGTSEIEVDTAGVEQPITATVAVDEGSGKPLPPGSTRLCHAEAHAITKPKAREVVDKFYFIAFDDVKARLDNYVIDLQSDPTSTAYLIYYSGAECRGGQDLRLGERSKEYLVKSRKFDPSRIVVMNGGQSAVDWVELHIVPLGGKVPTPRPNEPPEVRKDLKQYPCVKDRVTGPQFTGPRVISPR